MTLRVSILISGNGSNMEALIKSMVGDFPARPVFVGSDKAGALGLVKAKNLGVCSGLIERVKFANRTDFETALIHALEEHKTDIICLAGFMRVLSAEFATYFSGRILNIHPSLLPKYKGLNTYARALEAKDKEAGCSVHLVTPELDSGPILGQRAVPIYPHDTADTLAKRILVEEHLLYPEALRNFIHTRPDLAPK